MNLPRQLFPVLLALPLATAAAEPVRITTQMSGQINAFPLILEAMGFGDYWDTPGPLPFSLQIDSIVDPDDAAHWCSDNWCYNLPAGVSYSLTINGKTVGFTDPNDSARVAWTPTRFLHGISYTTVPYPATSGYFVSVETWVDAPEGRLNADPFAPQSLAGGPGITGDLQLSVMPTDPEVPGHYSAYASADSLRFQVSAVPEPRHAGLLAAGLLVLAAASRRPAPARAVRPT